MRSIKSKLILGVSLLILVLFTITALLLVSEKKSELTHDIYLQTRALTELTAPKIVELNESYLAENSFVLFSRELKNVLFRKTQDIASIFLFTFSGEMLFDSKSEVDRVYKGEKRLVKDDSELERIKSRLPSYTLKNGRTVYLKKYQDGTFAYVDRDEKSVEPILDTDRITNIVFPVDGRFAVQFDLTYNALDQRIARMQERIFLLLIFGVLLGFGFAWYFSGRITRPIKKLTEGALVLATGDFSVRVPVQTRDEVGILAQTFNQMAVDLQKSVEARIYKERVAKELELAAKIQSQILPKSMPKVNGIEVSAQLLPAVEVGGDSYDFISLNEDKHIFYLGDATGHGVPAGIVVSIANALIYTFADSPNLIDLVVNVNKIMKQKTAQNMFMTMVMAKFERDQLTFVSAGHPALLHYKASTNTVELAPTGGIALGMVPDVSKLIKELAIDFNKGDIVVLYSDGVPEAVAPDGSMYGMERFQASLIQSAPLVMIEEISKKLLDDVTSFISTAEASDDVTFVVVRRT